MIDAELDFETQLDVPPPPPKKEESADEKNGEEDFFVIVEQMPELIGGLATLQQEVRYPEKALRANIEGRVYVQFIVNEKGEVENPRVIRGIGGGCDEEAIRVVKMAEFKPGLQRGRPVRVQFQLPVIFRIKT
jgi:protein TonB